MEYSRDLINGRSSKLKDSYIAGIDIGTTNIKGVIFSSTGKLISSSSISYQSYSPRESYHEQNPDDWVKGVIKVLEELTFEEKIKKNLVAISFSTQGGTIVPVDRDFNPLHRAITWLDRRGLEVLSSDKSLSRKNIWFYDCTGWRLDSNMSFLPLMWLKSNKPEIFTKIHKIFYVNDYIMQKISGAYSQDPSNASISLFYNVKEGKWEKNILRIAGLNANYFSEIRQSGEHIGYLSSDISQKLGLKSKIKIINGGHDQYCASISAGIIDDKSLLLATGTAWVLFKLLEEPLFDSKKFFASGRSVIKGKFGLIYSIPAAGASISWFAIKLLNLKSENNLFEIEKKYFNELSQIKNNIIYHPYLTGSYGPDFDIERKASFTNINIGHNYLDIYISILEGAGFQLKKILIALQEKKINVKEIKMVGGASRSKLWTQIISDITGLNISVPVNPKTDFASSGAAILAGFGAGIFKSINEGYETLKGSFNVVNPKAENAIFYEKKFKLF